MTGGDPSELILHARLCVREAINQWNGADLAQINRSRRLLEDSVRDLKMAMDLLRNSASNIQHDFQPMVKFLRSDISSMIRLVDACVAFHRGLRLSRGGPAPAYDAAGNTVAEPETQRLSGLVG